MCERERLCALIGTNKVLVFIHYSQEEACYSPMVGMFVGVQLFGVCALIGTNTVFIFINYSDE